MGTGSQEREGHLPGGVENASPETTVEPGLGLKDQAEREPSAGGGAGPAQVIKMRGEESGGGDEDGELTEAPGRPGLAGSGEDGADASNSVVSLKNKTSNIQGRYRK